MIWGKTYQEAKDWHRWWAWCPVRLECGRYAWFTTVERRPSLFVWHYREVKDA